MKFTRSRNMSQRARSVMVFGTEGELQSKNSFLTNDRHMFSILTDFHPQDTWFARLGDPP